MHFPKSESKGEKFDRIVYLTDEALSICRMLMAQHSTGPLFRNLDGNPWTTDAVNCAFIQLQTRLGLQKMERKKVTRRRLPKDEAAKSDHLKHVAQLRKERRAVEVAFKLEQR